MTISEFINSHCLHDSLLEKAVYKDHYAELTIDFCFWMQDGYSETNPETGIITLRFPDVTDYQGPLGDIDDYSILEADYNDSVFTLLLMDDFNNTTYELKISSNAGTAPGPSRRPPRRRPRR